MIRFSIPVFAVTTFLVANHSTAYAYLDPGAMSLILQAIIAGLAGAAATWKYWYWRLLTVFRIKKKKPDTGNNVPDKQQSEGE